MRTFLAHERTRMAWIRTALALISFGFGIAKFFEYLREEKGEHGPLLGPRAVGILMIGIGLVALTLSNLQHWRALRTLHAECPGLPKSLSWITAMLLAVLGLLALFGAVIRG
ncbi:MAG: YidH family protein [Burkholderiales bacterium]